MYYSEGNLVFFWSVFSTKKNLRLTNLLITCNIFYTDLIYFFLCKSDIILIIGTLTYPPQKSKTGQSILEYFLHLTNTERTQWTVDLSVTEEVCYVRSSCSNLVWAGWQKSGMAILWLISYLHIQQIWRNPRHHQHQPTAVGIPPPSY